MGYKGVFVTRTCFRDEVKTQNTKVKYLGSIRVSKLALIRKQFDSIFTSGFSLVFGDSVKDKTGFGSVLRRTRGSMRVLGGFGSGFISG